MIRIASLYEEWISPVADLFVRNNAFLNCQIIIRSLQLTITQRRTWMFTLKEKWPLFLFKHEFKRSRRFPPTDEGVYTFSTRNEWRTNPLPIFFSVQFSMGNERSLSTKLFTDVQILHTIKPIHSFYNEHLRTTRGTKAQEHKTSSSMDTFRAVRIRNTMRSADDLSDSRLQHAKEIASPRTAAELQSFGSNSFPAPKSHSKLYRSCNLCWW